MKSEPYPKTKLSYESEDHSSDVDDPSQSENELEIITSAEEEEKEEEGRKGKEDEGVVRCENNDCEVVHKSVISSPQATGHLGNINANFFLEELTPDDEILTFQCPRNFNVNSLLNQEFDLNKVSKIKDGGNKFKCQVLPNNKKTFACIFPSKEKNAALVKLPVAGHIVIKQSIKLPKKKVLIEEVETRDEKMEIKDSGMRHPLLGKNWKEHVSMVRKQIKKQKKILKKSMEHRRSLVKAEKERKEQKKILKAQLSLLKKSLSTEAL